MSPKVNNFDSEILGAIARLADSSAKLADLTTELAVTNQNLGHIGEDVKLHNDLFYGDKQGKGGLITMINRHENLLSDPEIGLVHQMNILTTKCVELAVSVQSQTDSVKSMNKVVRGLAALMAVLMLSIIGYKQIQDLLPALIGLISP